MLINTDSILPDQRSKKILVTFPIFHQGWELVSTDHGKICLLTEKEVNYKLKEYSAVTQKTLRALQIFNEGV